MSNDLVQSILTQEDGSVDQFLEAISSKIEDAIEVKRVELASSMFAEASKKCPECGKADCECDDEDYEDEDDDDEEDDDKEEMKEQAKWRTSSAAKPDPDHDWDRSSKSTGGMRATSDTRGDTGGEYNHSSLENRRKAQVASKGPNAGKTTKASNASLKGRILGNLANKQSKPNLPEEVEQTEEGYRPHHTNPKPGWALDPATKAKFAEIERKRATKAKYVGKSIPKSDKMEEAFVIHKGKHEPGAKSSLGGQTLHGVSVKDVYTNKKEAQAHADKINAGRGYKPGDEKNSLYGGVLYQVSPAKSMNEKAPPGAKYERMVKDIKKSYSKDGLTNKEKAISYATAWKAKNREMKEEVSDMQKMSALGMKGTDRSSTISALRAYRQHGDINKLSAGHRSLVASYMEKTGGLGAVNRSAALSALKKEKAQE